MERFRKFLHQLRCKNGEDSFWKPRFQRPELAKFPNSWCDLRTQRRKSEPMMKNWLLGSFRWKPRPIAYFEVDEDEEEDTKSGAVQNHCGTEPQTAGPTNVWWFGTATRFSWRSSVSCREKSPSSRCIMFGVSAVRSHTLKISWPSTKRCLRLFHWFFRAEDGSALMKLGEGLECHFCSRKWQPVIWLALMVSRKPDASNQSQGFEDIRKASKKRLIFEKDQHFQEIDDQNQLTEWDEVLSDEEIEVRRWVAVVALR